MQRIAHSAAVWLFRLSRAGNSRRLIWTVTRRGVEPRDEGKTLEKASPFLSCRVRVRCHNVARENQFILLNEKKSWRGGESNPAAKERPCTKLMMPSSLARRVPLQRRRDVARGVIYGKHLKMSECAPPNDLSSTLHNVKHRRRAMAYSFEGFTNAGMSFPLSICLSM